MACIINASTSAGLVQTADLSGVLQFQQNGVALPNGGVAPAFSAYANASQSISSGTYTKVQINTEDFDTNSNFDNVTNYRFTPTVAGYYQINAGTFYSGTTVVGYVISSIYKNNSLYKASYSTYESLHGIGGASVSSVIYFNGSTDQVEFWTYQFTGASQPTGTGSAYTYFNGSLVRGA
jgi:hypothetical protein